MSLKISLFSTRISGNFQNRMPQKIVLLPIFYKNNYKIARIFYFSLADFQKIRKTKKIGLEGVIKTILIYEIRSGIFDTNKDKKRNNIWFLMVITVRYQDIF